MIDRPGDIASPTGTADTTPHDITSARVRRGRDHDDTFSPVAADAGPVRTSPRSNSSCTLVPIRDLITNEQKYRDVLTIPGVATSLLLTSLARVPLAATGITMTLHVVSALDRGYGAAGLVGTMTTAGTAIGSPLVGRLFDRFGLRPVVASCAAATTAFWLTAPLLPYYWLLLIAMPAGALLIPVGSLARQVLAALVPHSLRRTAYSLESIAVELSFMLGPAAALVLATQGSTSAALVAIGLAFGTAGVLLCWTNPPLRSDGEVDGSARPPVREWFTPMVARALLTAVGALFVLVGMEVALLAALRASGDVGWTSVAFVVICTASVLGGLAHGAAHRSLSQLRLMTLLAALTVPVGIVSEPWWLLVLALIPMNLVCAPTIAATSEAVTRHVPARVRGEAVGWQASAMQLGLALGSPVVGFAIDHTSPAGGFATAGGCGLVIAAAAFLLGRRHRARANPAPAARTGGSS